MNFKIINAKYIKPSYCQKSALIIKILVVFGIIIFVAGCDIFEPRKADEPINNQYEWNDYTSTPNQILENLVWSYEYIQNAENYQNIFTNDFVFYFDSQDVSEHGYPSSWSLDNEINVIQDYYFQSSDDVSIEIELSTNSESDQINSNDAHLYRDYTITTTDEIEDFPNTFAGKLELYLIFEDGVWLIKTWKDFRSDSSDTWGRFKHEFAS